MIGGVDIKYFDNPNGGQIWGDLAFEGLKPGEAYESIFDFGSGCGREARRLMLMHGPPKKYLGIDISKGMIRWCEKNLTPHNKNFRFIYRDIYHISYAPKNRGRKRALPFPAEAAEFSFANVNSVFTHLYHDQSLYYLNEISRVLKLKGAARTTWFFFNKRLFPMLAPHQHCLYVNAVDPTQAVFYDWEQFLRDLKALGLVVLNVVWPIADKLQTEVFLGKQGFFQGLPDAAMKPPATVVGYGTPCP